MIKFRYQFLCVTASLFLFTIYGCQTMNSENTSKDDSSSQAGITAKTSSTTKVEKTPQVEVISTETASRIVEDGGTGPFKAIMVSDSTLSAYTIFRPKDMNLIGKDNKLPVIAWGNGACANSPREHLNFLSEIASYGFLVIAIGPMPQAQQGQRGGGVMGEGMMGRGGATRGGGTTGASNTSSKPLLLAAIDWAISQDSNQTSMYYNKIDTTKIAVAGMSCGGLQAYQAAPDPRVTTLMICNSGIFNTPMGGDGLSGMPSLTKNQLAKLHTPVIYILGGESDMAYPNGMDDFKRINDLPVFAANLKGIGHGGTYGRPHGGEFARVATAWLEWQLKGDKEAAKMFTGEPCGVAQMEGWTVEKKNIP